MLCVRSIQYQSVHSLMLALVISDFSGVDSEKVRSALISGVNNWDT